MLQKSLVSICIPAFNCERYIGATIESLFRQTYSNIEIIVVDDGSTDNTAAILMNIDDSRLQYHYQKNTGAASARNNAYRFAKGEYIKFLDGDDIISANCIAQQVAVLKNCSDCVASSKWGRFFQDDLSDFRFSPEKVWRTLPGIDWIVESLAEEGTNMTQPGIFLIPKTLIDKVGLWDESLTLIDDFDFMTRILVNADEVKFCEEAILYYRGGMEGSLSMRKTRQAVESAYNAQVNGINAILEKRNDKRSRLACANSLQHWAYIFYPRHLKYYNSFNDKVRELGGSVIKLEGGKIFSIARDILGWKLAKRLREMTTSFTKKADIKDPKFLIPKNSRGETYSRLK